MKKDQKPTLKKDHNRKLSNENNGKFSAATSLGKLENENCFGFQHLEQQYFNRKLFWLSAFGTAIF